VVELSGGFEDLLDGQVNRRDLRHGSYASILRMVRVVGHLCRCRSYPLASLLEGFRERLTRKSDGSAKRLSCSPLSSSFRAEPEGAKRAADPSRAPLRLVQDGDDLIASTDVKTNDARLRRSAVAKSVIRVRRVRHPFCRLHSTLKM
jgi:hypothetical protein